MSVYATTVLPDRRRDSAVGGVTGSPLAHLTDLVTRVAADPDSWLPRVRLPHGDGRWWTQLSGDGQVDVWLLSWLPGQTTELHDHGFSAAAFTVVRGLLDEVRVDDRMRRVTVPRRPGSTVSLRPGVVHDVGGAGSGPAVSIHGYSPPLTRMTYYDADGHGGLRVTRTVQTHEPEEGSAR